MQRLEFSGAVQQIYMSVGGKGLNVSFIKYLKLFVRIPSPPQKKIYNPNNQLLRVKIVFFITFSHFRALALSVPN
jgi:hypothetical protein